MSSLSTTSASPEARAAAAFTARANPALPPIATIVAPAVSAAERTEPSRPLSATRTSAPGDSCPTRATSCGPPRSDGITTDGRHARCPWFVLAVGGVGSAGGVSTSGFTIWAIAGNGRLWQPWGRADGDIAKPQHPSGWRSTGAGTPDKRKTEKRAAGDLHIPGNAPLARTDGGDEPPSTVTTSTSRSGWRRRYL